jgi:hypothetical protein
MLLGVPSIGVLLIIGISIVPNELLACKDTLIIVMATISYLWIAVVLHAKEGHFKFRDK